MAGQRDGLYSYDGYRVSKAGTFGLSSATTVTNGGGAGALTGVYSYLLRPARYSPNEVISYGPVSTFSVTHAASQGLITLSGPTDETAVSYSNGIRAQSAASSTVAAVAGGAVSRYVDDFYDPIRIQPGEKLFIKSNSGVLGSNWFSSTVTAANGASLTLSTSVGTPAVGDPFSFGDRVEVYRTLAGGSTYYYLEDIALADGVTYTDNTTDVTLAAREQYSELAYTPVAPPDVVVACTVHQNRAVVIGEYALAFRAYRTAPIRTVFYTEPNTQEFTADNSFVVDLTNGDDLVACYSFEDTLYLASKTSLWAVQGALGSGATFTVTRLPNGQGLVSSAAFTALQSRVFGVSRFGVFAVEGASVDYAPGLKINALIRYLPTAVTERIRVHASENEGRLYVTIPGVSLSTSFTNPGSGTTVTNVPTSAVLFTEAPGSTVLTYDTLRDIWYLYQPQTPVAGGFVTLDDQLLAFPKRQESPIVAFDDTWGSDAWTAVEMAFESPWEDLDDPTTNKNFARAQILSTDDGKQNFVLEVTTETDWSGGKPVGAFDLGFKDGQGYGETAYGTQPYGDPNVTDHVVPLTNHKAKSMRLVIRNDDPAEKPTISGWVLEVGANSRNAKED
jgi:hypothetical protein